jgi:DsbC/DsbD-like thiol-disulfide interchange protein
MKRILHTWMILAVALVASWGEACGQSIGLAVADDAPVKATLVAEVTTGVSGVPFRAAVKLQHAPEWHTYGKVLPPEVIGKPTSLKWTLPEGWVVEELPWPETHEVPSTDGKKSVGYDGTVYLPVKITPKGAAGTSGELKVKVDALACDPKNCMPQRPEASMTVALGEVAVVNAEMAEVFAKMPGMTVPKAEAVEGVVKKAERSFLG